MFITPLRLLHQTLSKAAALALTGTGRGKAAHLGDASKFVYNAAAQRWVTSAAGEPCVDDKGPPPPPTVLPSSLCGLEHQESASSVLTPTKDGGSMPQGAAGTPSAGMWRRGTSLHSRYVDTFNPQQPPASCSKLSGPGVPGFGIAAAASSAAAGVKFFTPGPRADAVTQGARFVSGRMDTEPKAYRALFPPTHGFEVPSRSASPRVHRLDADGIAGEWGVRPRLPHHILISN